MGLFDGYAQVQPIGYMDNPNIRKSISGLTEIRKEIESVSNGIVVSERAQTFALLSNKSHTLAAMVVGVRPESDRKVSRIASLIRDGRYLHSDSDSEVIIGSALARNLSVKVGDRITLLGTGWDGSVAADVLTVAGIFSSGVSDLDRQLVEMPISRFQSDFAMNGKANVLVISGNSLSSVTKILPTIRERLKPKGLNVLNWGDLEPGLKDAIHLDASTSMLWYVVLVLMSVAILLNTLMMSVLERTHEFGILLALGMRPSKVARMVWLEILMLLALGLTIGIALGALASGWYSIHGLALPGSDGVFAKWGIPGRMYPQITSFSLLAAPIAIAIFTSLTGLFPLVHLRRLQPVSAMRAL